MDSMLVGISAILVTSGIWFAILRRTKTHATTAISHEPGEDRQSIYEARLHGLSQWHSIFTALQPALVQSTTVAAMAEGIKNSVRQINPKSNILLAIDQMGDSAPLDQADGDRTAQAIISRLFIASYPEIEADLSGELARLLYQTVLAKTPIRRWWSLHELAPEIQSRLLKQYHLAGQAIVVPLHINDKLAGIILLSGFDIEGSADLLRDTGERAAFLGEMLTTRMHFALAHSTKERSNSDPNAFLIDALASLETMEQTVLSLQEQAASEEMLNALADYSLMHTEQIAETSQLAIQTCQSLRRICQAEFAMVLFPKKGGGFAAEAMELDDWSWSHFASLQKQTTMHPQLRDEHLLKSWPDSFARKAYTSEAFDHAVTHKEVFQLANRLSQFDLESVLIRPAMLNEQLLGLLVIGMKRPGGFPETVVAVTASVTAITAMSLKGLQVTQERGVALTERDSARGLSGALAKQIVDALTFVATTHGILTIRRPEEVARYSLLLAQHLSISKADMFHLRLAALTCDLGMVAVPSSILRKETGFTTDEWKLIQSHPHMSVKMLKEIVLFKEALPLILHHHEQWDGTGYPDSLRGASIPMGSRIIALADAFVNMQSRRPYREALSAANAIQEIRQKAGTQFDPDLVKTFVKALKAEAAQSAEAA